MSARVTFLAAMFLLGYVNAASAACAGAISEFETIVTSDVNTGNLNKSVYGRIVSELRAVKASCATGHDGEASHGLAAVKSRHGYR